MICTIIFDLDGTLVNLNLNMEKLVSEIEDLIQTKIDSGPFLESIISHTKENPHLRQKIWNTIDRIEKENIHNLQIFPETIPVLNEIKSRNYNLALVTLQGQKATSLILRKLSLTAFFNPIITRENSYLRSQQLELALESLQLAKDQALFVGDRLNDLEESQKAGIKCILIRRKFNPLKGVIVIKSLSDLLQYI
jgi:HAD superfamily hydrolase (TIGR01549 family)